MAVFWDVAPWSVIDIDLRFREANSIRHRRDEWSVYTKLHGAELRKAANFIFKSARTLNINYDTSMLATFLTGCGNHGLVCKQKRVRHLAHFLLQLFITHSLKQLAAEFFKI
jgi:hypothetical protein